MAEQDPLAMLILDMLRRRRRATVWDIVQEIFLEPRPRDVERVRNLLRRLEIAGAVARHEETVRGPVKRIWYYDLRTLRTLVARRPGRRLTERELSETLGIPLSEIPRVTAVAIQKGWLRETGQAGVYQVPEKIWRVQKMRMWRTEKNPWKYTIEMGEKIKLPTQMVLEGYAPETETDTLSEGVHGALRIVVYTPAPQLWPEERLERIMRGLFAQEGITMEIYSDLPHIRKTQAYEAEEVDIDEKPPEIELDTPDMWLWVAKKNGETYAYHYTRRPWGWTYERYRVR